jgi:hypothetical protein
MSDINIRRELRAKGKPIRIDSALETTALEFITNATTGTFVSGTSTLGITVRLNGTNYKIPVYS